ncbi:MAG: hypothetical protein VX111_13030, partial [Planctomycetota bacterium]|nr:hypothetical protein [Planctomycetota bacterium]
MNDLAVVRGRFLKEVIVSLQEGMRCEQIRSLSLSFCGHTEPRLAYLIGLSRLRGLHAAAHKA